MARLPRIDVPGIPQHLIVRGNNRCAIFRDDADRTIFLGLLESALRTCSRNLHAFVLVTNHVHVLATADADGGIPTTSTTDCRRAWGARSRRYRRADRENGDRKEKEPDPN